MAWIKIPAEHHPLFHAALPKDPRITTMQMFGGVCSMVNGNMFAGLFGRSAIVKLSETDQREALALDGAVPFDPMGTGRVMTNTVLLPDAVMDEPPELASWIRRALDYTGTLPPKKKKQAAAKKPPAKKPAARKPAKKPATKKPAKKPATKKPAKKPAAKRR